MQIKQLIICCIVSLLLILCAETAAAELAKGTETQITADESGQISPAIYGNKIVFTDYRNRNPDIYLFTLCTPEK